MAGSSAGTDGAGEGECHARQFTWYHDCLHDRRCWLLTSLLIVVLAVVAHVVRTGEISLASIAIKLLDGGLQRLNLGPTGDQDRPAANVTPLAPATDEGTERSRERRRRLQDVIRNQEELADEIDGRCHQMRKED